MEKTTLQLLEAVDRERMKLQMSDAQFSRRVLGISPSYLCRLKNGERAITLDLLKLFMQKLPEITPAVTIYFMSQGDGDTPDGDSPKNPDKTGVANKVDLLRTRKTIKTARKT